MYATARSEKRRFTSRSSGRRGGESPHQYRSPAESRAGSRPAHQGERGRKPRRKVGVYRLLPGEVVLEYDSLAINYRLRGINDTFALNDLLALASLRAPYLL